MHPPSSKFGRGTCLFEPALQVRNAPHGPLAMLREKDVEVCLGGSLRESQRTVLNDILHRAHTCGYSPHPTHRDAFAAYNGHFIGRRLN